MSNNTSQTQSLLLRSLTQLFSAVGILVALAVLFFLIKITISYF